KYTVAVFFLVFGLYPSLSAELEGKVINRRGEPLPTTAIQIKGINKVYYSDEKGNFLIPINTNVGDTLRARFSRVDCKPVDTLLALRRGAVVYMDDNYIMTDKVVVTGTRTAKNLKNHPIATEVISQSDITASGNLRLGDALAEEAGLTVIQDHGKGVQIQGLDPQYAVILINGEPIGGSATGSGDLDRIGISNLKRIEIVKGPASSLYGSNALAGVINLITDEPESPFKLNLSARYGSHNTLELAGAASHYNALNDFGLSLDFNRLSSDGYKIDPNSVGNAVPKFDNFTSNLSATYKFAEETTLKLHGRINSQGQFNSYPSLDSAKPASQDNSAMLVGGGGLTLKSQLNEDVNAELRVYGGINDISTYYSYADADTAYYNYEYYENLQKVEAQSNYMVSRSLLLTGGAGWNREGAKTEIIAGGKRFADLFYGFFQADWFPTKKLNTIASARYDSHSDYASKFSPKLAASYKLFDDFTLRSSVGTGFKAPTFEELYLNWNNPIAGYSVFGSSNFTEGLEALIRDSVISEIIVAPDRLKALLPEHSISYSAGFSAELFGVLDVNASAFYNQIKDMIEFMRVARNKNGSYVNSYVNLSKIYTQGFELSASYKPYAWLSVSTNYQFLQTGDFNAEKRIENKEIYKKGKYGARPVQMVEYGGLFNRSNHSGSLKISVSDKESGFTASLRGTFRTRYGIYDKNGNEILDDESEYAPGYAMWNLSAAKDFANRFNVQIGVDNLTDYVNRRAMTYSSGRTYFAKLSYIFDYAE
ncbi:MAG: TonB-dependent receptor domain-containing protein, partial [Chloroflexota bacterium]